MQLKWAWMAVSNCHRLVATYISTVTKNQVKREEMLDFFIAGKVKV